MKIKIFCNKDKFRVNKMEYGNKDTMNFLKVLKLCNNN